MSEHQFKDREVLKPLVGRKVKVRGVLIGFTDKRPHRAIITSVYAGGERNFQLDHVLIGHGANLFDRPEIPLYHWVEFKAVVNRYKMPKRLKAQGRHMKILVETYGLDEASDVKAILPGVIPNGPLSEYCQNVCRKKWLDTTAIQAIPNDGSREYWLERLVKGATKTMIETQAATERIPGVDEYGRSIPGLMSRYKVNTYGDVFEKKTPLTPLNHNGKLVYLLVDQDEQRVEYQAPELVAKTYLNYNPKTSKLVFRDGNNKNARLSNLEVKMVAPAKPIAPVKPAVKPTDSSNDWDNQRRPIPYFPDGWEVSRSGKVYHQGKRVYPGDVGRDHHPALRRIDETRAAIAPVTLKMLAGFAFHPDRFGEATTTVASTNIPYNHLDPTKLDLQELKGGNGIRPRVRAFGNLLSGIPYQNICTKIGIVHGRRGKAVVFADGSVAVVSLKSQTVISAALGDVLQAFPALNAERIKELVNTKALYDFYKERNQHPTVADHSKPNRPAPAPRQAVKPVVKSATKPVATPEPKTSTGLTLEKNGVKVSGLSLEQVKELLKL